MLSVYVLFHQMFGVASPVHQAPCVFPCPVHLFLILIRVDLLPAFPAAPNFQVVSAEAGFVFSCQHAVLVFMLFLVS